MKFLGVFILMLMFKILAFGQSSPRQYLFAKADSLLIAQNFEQARYYYLLSMKQKGLVPADDVIKKKIITLDSSLAYQSDNQDYILLIQKADNLLKEKKFIEALKFFDDAADVEPSYDYSHARIDQILGESEEIKKKLLIYNAKQSQLSYFKILNDIENLESAGYHIEAYYEYKEFAKSFHGDSLARSRATSIYKNYKKDIQNFESYLFQAEEYYQQGNYAEAFDNYTMARSLNPKCNLCEARLEHTDFCINEEFCRGDDFEELLIEATYSFESGKYEKAYYQFVWLQNLQPENQEVMEYISQLENLLETETDNRMRKFNADIALEKANDAFMDGRYEEALKEYMKLKNAYSNVIDYLQFVEIRIAECLNEVDK